MREPSHRKTSGRFLSANEFREGFEPLGDVDPRSSRPLARKAGADGLEGLDRKDVYDAARICEHLGETWEVEQTYLKPYASCRYAHAATDAMLSLRRSHHARADGFERLVVEVFPEAFTITNEMAPTTLEGAQFSIPFCVALAALRGASAFRPLQIESLRDPEVLALARHVEMIGGEDFRASFPTTTPSRVRLTQGGKEVLATVIHPLGDVANPMSWDQVEEKFHDLARAAPGVPPEAVIAACRALAHGDLDAGGLRGALAGPGPPQGGRRPASARHRAADEAYSGEHQESPAANARSPPSASRGIPDRGD